MAKIKAPLFSIDASGTLDKSITYKNKPQAKTASKYSKPGSVNPFESSPRQKDQRTIIGLITAAWQSKTSLDQLAWNNAAKDARFKGTGYHYFLHLAQSDLTTYLGLVGFWSMNYNIGNKIPDLSGNGNHGTLGPIFPCDSPSLTNSSSIKQGKSLYFNGIDGYLKCPTYPPSYFKKDFTIEIIVKPRPQGLPRAIISKGSDMSFLYLVGTTLVIKFRTASWAYICNMTCDPVPYNEYTHITVIYDTSTTCSVFLNGHLANTHSDVAFGSDLGRFTSTFFLARLQISAIYPIHGFLDNFICFDRILSPSEVYKHYELLLL